MIEGQAKPEVSEKPAPVGLDPREVFAVFASLCGNPEALGRARQWVRSEASRLKQKPSENEVGRVAGQYLMREAANLVSGYAMQADAIGRAVERMQEGATAPEASYVEKAHREAEAALARLETERKEAEAALQAARANPEAAPADVAALEAEIRRLENFIDSLTPKGPAVTPP